MFTVNIKFYSNQLKPSRGFLKSLEHPSQMQQKQKHKTNTLAFPHKNFDIKNKQNPIQKSTLCTRYKQKRT